MLSRFGITDLAAANYAIAFAIILVVVALFGLVLRRLTGGRPLLPGHDRGRARQPRLGIVDIYDLDRRRQLILLRRDNVEHLLLIGGPNDVVIETNIVRVPGARLPTAATDTIVERGEPAERAPDVAAPRPHVEPAPRPTIEAQLAARLGAPPSRGNGTSDAERETAPLGTASAAAAGRLEPPQRAEPAPPVPPQRPIRAEQPPVRPEPGRREPAAPARPVAATRAPEPARPAPPPARSPEPGRPPEPPHRPEPTPRSPDAGVLSNMARQLEEALRRPASPAPQSQTPPGPPRPATSPPGPPRPTAPVQVPLPSGGSPAPATASGSTAPPGDPTARPARPLPPAPARPSFIPPAPIPSAPPASAPPPSAAPEVKIEPPSPAQPQPAPARPTPPSSAQKKVDDPFSRRGDRG